MPQIFDNNVKCGIKFYGGGIQAKVYASQIHFWKDSHVGNMIDTDFYRVGYESAGEISRFD